MPSAGCVTLSTNHHHADGAHRFWLLGCDSDHVQLERDEEGDDNTEVTWGECLAGRQCEAIQTLTEAECRGSATDKHVLQAKQSDPSHRGEIGGTEAGKRGS